MKRVDWCSKLNWTEENLEDLRMAGYHYLRQGKYEIARDFFEALVVLAPNSSSYDLQTMGALCLEMNEPVEALKWLDQALKLEADHTATLLNISKALLMLGKKQEALRLAKVLSKDKNLRIANLAKALLLAWG